MHLPRRLYLLFLALGGVGAFSAQAAWWPKAWPDQSKDLPVARQRFQRGDRPEWARRDLDDSAWPFANVNALPMRAGVFWVRIHLHHVRPFDAMATSAVAAFDLYWDGRLIGRSGAVGFDAAGEVPGPIYHLFRIPDELVGPGEHLLALRMSSYHAGFPGDDFQFLYGFGDLETYTRIRGMEAACALAGIGSYIVVAMIFGSLWLLVEHRRAWLLFSGACFSAALTQVVDIWRVLASYPYSWHYPLKILTVLAIATLGMLLVAFVQEFFRLRPRWPGLAAVAAVTLAAWSYADLYFIKGMLIALGALGVLLPHVAVAAWVRRHGARWVLAGVLVSAGVVWFRPAGFLSFTWFPLFFGAPALGCLAALTLQFRSERRAAQEAKLTSARLEIELLKKNLQPHFLLNTLTAVSEVIEQDPGAAVKFIDDLATEFRSLAQMSGERLVPLKRELDLCRMHLKVISRRTGRNIGLAIEEADETALVPPALFLTLIENGLVHQQADEGAAFRFAVQPAPGGIRYIFTSPGLTRMFTGRTVGGTGLRYVKARLEESFAGRWTFMQQQTLEGWETVIELQTSGRAGGAS